MGVDLGVAVALGLGLVTSAAWVLTRHKRGSPPVADDRNLRQEAAPAPPLQPDELEESWLGHTLDGYHILEQVAEGASATVYRARGPSGEDVAVKVYDRGSGPGFVKRFQRELQIATRLDHPSIVRVLAGGLRQDRPYLVMEMVQGASLRELIPAGGMADLGQVTACLEHVMDALHYAHERGVVHRDLKPENVAILPDGRVCLLDFGLARSHESDPITKKGEAVGSPYYMAPEQILCQPLDVRTDQYALGILAYELLTGDPPFVGKPAVRVLQRHLHETPAAIQRDGVSPGLQAVVFRLLSKTPEERYASMAEALAALRSARHP
ncbi:MAG: serine/threonine-protein kinase [Candidatus Eremiobacterota bacterium]